MIDQQKTSPFTPGSPAPYDLFVGREQQVKEILRFVRQAAKGRQENIFLSGERGIGKSSLGAYIERIAVSQENFLGIHVFLGGISDIPELVRRIFEQILQESNSQNWFKKISGFFGQYIQKVDLFGLTVSFNPPEDRLKDLSRNFPEAIANILKNISDEKKGLFIILDDINGLSKTPNFPNWYKSFVDYVSTHFDKFPVLIILIGLSEIRDALSESQPSLMRIFRVIDIQKLSDDEVKNFFEKAFGSVNISIHRKAMQLLVKFSSGLPILMQEIGDAVFWIDQDMNISEKDAISGIFSAAQSIGRKYLDPKVYRTIRSERYRSILRKLGEKPLSHFQKSKIEGKLNKSEKRVFNNFLRKMRELGIISQDIEKGRGHYRFVNDLYPIYIWMENQDFKK